MKHREDQNELIQQDLMADNESKLQRILFSKVLSMFAMVAVSIAFYFNLPGLWFLSPLLFAGIDITLYIIRQRKKTKVG